MTIDSNGRWYVAQTHPHAETKAAGHLMRQGFAVYLPRHLKRRRHARRVENVPAPLFPRYLFIAVDMATQRWRSIHSTIGVTRMVCNGDLPAAVSRQRKTFPASRFPIHGPYGSISLDDLQTLHPPPDTAVPHRSRPRGVGADHAATRCKQTRGRIWREAQPVGTSGVVQLGPGNRRPGAGGAALGVDREIGESSARAEVDDDARTNVAARHPAPRASGDEGRSCGRSLADEGNQILHSGGNRDGLRHESAQWRNVVATRTNWDDLGAAAALSTAAHTAYHFGAIRQLLAGLNHLGTVPPALSD